jgi:hypothetical protein
VTLNGHKESFARHASHSGVLSGRAINDFNFQVPRIGFSPAVAIVAERINTSPRTPTPFFMNTSLRMSVQGRRPPAKTAFNPTRRLFDWLLGYPLNGIAAELRHFVAKRQEFLAAESRYALIFSTLSHCWITTRDFGGSPSMVVVLPPAARNLPPAALIADWACGT